MRKLLPAKLYSYLGNNQFLSLAGNVAVSGLGIVSLGLLYRALPIREVGLWIFFISNIGLADAFRTGFLTTAFIRACSGATPARSAEVIGSAWIIALAITGIMLLLNLVALFLPFAHQSTEMALLLRWFGLTLLATLPYYIATNVLQAEMRFDKILYIRLLSQGLFVLGVGIMLLTHTGSLQYVVYCYLAASVGTSLVSLALGWARLGSLRARTAACIWELTHFGKYSFGSYVATNLLSLSDTYFINFMLGPAALAIYSVAGRFGEIINIPLRSFTATAIPTLSAAYHQGRLAEVARLLRKNAGVLTWAFVPIILGTVLLADIPIALVGGNKYRGTEAANLLRIIMSLAILFPIDRFVGVTLDVVNQPRINMYKVLIMLATNIAGDTVVLLLFPNIYGITLASFPTAIVGFVYGYLQLKRFLPLSIRDIIVTGFWEARTLLWGVFGKTTPLRPCQEPTQPQSTVA
ncbi:oligosaccharide flippase family protein [Hymenobacter daeguensis]